MSEKDSEAELHEMFQENQIPKCYIITNPTSNSTLKEIFKDASKSSFGRGIPDRILFNEKNMLIIECKKQNLKRANDDLKIYKSKMNNIKNIEIFFMAFVSKTTYRIYDINFNILDIDFSSLTNKLNLKNINLGNIDMESIGKYVHDIHDYIRDNTKISNEDKSFFIAIIIIASKKPTFKKYLMHGFNGRTIYKCIEECLKNDELDISVFSFFESDNNNIHLRTIIDKVMFILDNCDQDDVLNIFYTEFVRYSNTDSKSLGIVLTPHNIVQLMINLLQISNSDVFLDLCSGTGSFLIESLKYNPKKIIGCEFQTKLYQLLKCNMIIRNLVKSKYEIYKNDCFNQDFACTKSAINPPYGIIDGNIEFDFIIKQLNSLKDGGLAVAIIPLSNLRSRKTARHRDLLLSIATIKAIIKCSKTTFYPTASVQCCILFLKKSTGHQIKKDLIVYEDYSNDGYTINRGKGRCETSKAKNILHSITKDIIMRKHLYLLDKEDWANVSIDISRNIDHKQLCEINLEISYHHSKLQLHNSKNIPTKNCQHFQNFKITELFDIQTVPDVEYTETKYIYQIGALNRNNGIKRIVRGTKNAFYGNKIVLVSGGDGGAGLAFYQEDDFERTSLTTVLSPRDIILDRYTGIYCAQELSKYKAKYGRSEPWSCKRISNDTIRLPVDKTGQINYKYIHSLFG